MFTISKGIMPFLFSQCIKCITQLFCCKFTYSRIPGCNVIFLEFLNNVLICCHQVKHCLPNIPLDRRAPGGVGREGKRAGRFIPQREWTMDCLLHQSLQFYNNVFLFVGFQLWGLLISWFIKLSVKTIQPLILIYRRVYFVYHH